MKSTRLLVIILLLTPSLSFADMGSCYFMKVSIKTKTTGIKSGYFWIGTYDLYIEKQQESFIYHIKSDKKVLLVKEINDHGEIKLTDSNDVFSEYVLSLLEDTIKLSSDLVKIRCKGSYDELRLIPGFAGELTKIPKSDILTIDIDYILSCVPGEWLMTTLNSNDKTWIENNNLIRIEFLGGFGMCGYEAFVYQEMNHSVVAEVSKLKELIKLNDAHMSDPGRFSKDEIQQVIQKINTKVKELKAYKIVVVKSCSC